MKSHFPLKPHPDKQSDRLTAKIQSRPFRQPLTEPLAPPGHDFSQVDLFAHAPVRHPVQARLIDPASGQQVRRHPLPEIASGDRAAGTSPQVQRQLKEGEGWRTLGIWGFSANTLWNALTQLLSDIDNYSTTITVALGEKDPPTETEALLQQLNTAIATYINQDKVISYQQGQALQQQWSQLVTTSKQHLADLPNLLAQQQSAEESDEESDTDDEPKDQKPTPTPKLNWKEQKRRARQQEEKERKQRQQKADQNRLRKEAFRARIAAMLVEVGQEEARLNAQTLTTEYAAGLADDMDEIRKALQAETVTTADECDAKEQHHQSALDTLKQQITRAIALEATVDQVVQTAQNSLRNQVAALLQHQRNWGYTGPGIDLSSEISSLLTSNRISQSVGKSEILKRVRRWARTQDWNYNNYGTSIGGTPGDAHIPGDGANNRGKGSGFNITRHARQHGKNLTWYNLHVT